MQKKYYTTTAVDGTSIESKISDDLSGTELYNCLTAYGTVYNTRHKLKNPQRFVDWTEENFEYVKYNPRKDINRYGLSITSLDGGLSGIPDLDSLIEYEQEFKIQYLEQDFRTKTPVYYYEELKELLDPIESNIFRSHVLKLSPGGFFPPHRDYFGTYFDSFRAIIPLKNMNPPRHNFIIEDKIIQWKMGGFYFVDTAKLHYLFNASLETMYMIVLNIDLTKETVRFVTENMEYG